MQLLLQLGIDRFAQQTQAAELLLVQGLYAEHAVPLFLLFCLVDGFTAGHVGDFSGYGVGIV